MPTHEINLLPPIRHAWLKRQNTFGKVSGFLSAVILGLTILTFSAGISMGVLWVMSQMAVPTTSLQFQTAVDKYRLLKQAISDQNDILQYLNSLSRGQLVWTDFLHPLFTAAPTGIAITHLDGNYDNQTKAGVPIINLKGEAANRNVLINFETALKTLPQLASVEAPVSNLLDRTNSIFQFKLILKPAGL